MFSSGNCLRRLNNLLSLDSNTQLCLVFIENTKITQTSLLFAIALQADMTSHFEYVFFSLRFHIYLTFSLWLRKARNRKKIIISLLVVSLLMSFQ